jgi:hypothetical protein
MRIVLVGAGRAAQRRAETLRANGHEGPRSDSVVRRSDR